MKIFQILDNRCHWQTPYKSIKETKGLYAPDIIFVEAPDYVEEGYTYENGEFSAPKEPEIEIDENEVKLIRIAVLKQKLAETDYKAIKYAEGLLLEKEYSKIKAERQAWRDEINQLEVELEANNGE